MMDPIRGSPVGFPIENYNLAWPLRKDDTQNLHTFDSKKPQKIPKTPKNTLFSFVNVGGGQKDT